MLPGLLADGRLATQTYSAGDDRRRAFREFALALHVAAVYLRKLGETNLAWIAVDQGDIAAGETEDPTVILALRRGVAHVQLGAGLAEEAVNGTLDAAGELAPGWWESSPTALSLYGTLFLNGAVAAARTGDRDQTKEMLDQAKQAAERLGAGHDEMWTAFGPANVEIHRLATALEFEDFQCAVDVVPGIQGTGLPAERKARLRLDVARAYAETGQTEKAVAALKRAYTTAPEQIRAHEFARDLARRLHKRTRSRDVEELAMKLGAVQ